MSIYKPNPQDNFGESEEQSRFKWARIWMMILAVAAGFVMMQTEFSIVFLTPSRVLKNLPGSMAADRGKQKQIAERYKFRTGKDPERGLVFHDLFSPRQREMLSQAEASLLTGDEFKNFREEFKRLYGFSYEDFNAVVIPAWLASNEVNSQQLGLTPDGWKATEEGPMSSYFVGGFTVRDRVRDEWEATLNGTPRIAVDWSAFQSPASLRRALYHEMLHASNVPGYYPCSLNIFQTDLDYFPEYRGFVSRARLSTFTRRYGALILLTIVFLFFLYKLYVAFLLPPRRDVPAV